MRIQAVLIGALTLIASCDSGPYEAEEASGHAVTLSARYLPAPSFPVDLAGLTLQGVRRCYPNFEFNSGDALTNEFAQWYAPYSPEVMRFDLTAQRNREFPASICGVNDFVNSRFFRVRGGFIPSGSAPDVIADDDWAAFGTDLIYSRDPGTIQPFPDGPVLEVPAGYSMLRRSCPAADGQIATTVTGPDAPIVLSPVPPEVRHLGTLESAEASFLQSCGVTLPSTPDLGVPISFDLASKLTFTPDGRSLVYLHPSDATSPTSFVDVRSVRVADGASSQIARFETAFNLAVAPDGQLYVSRLDGVFRVTPAATGPAIEEELPVEGDAQLSPDGRFFAYTTYASGDLFAPLTRVWDVTHDVTLDTGPGQVVQWSPGSELVVADTGLELRSLQGSRTSLVFPGPYNLANVTDSGLPVAQLTWPTADQAVMASFGAPWVFATTAHGSEDACHPCLGLELGAAGAAATRKALDASAGTLTLLPNAPGTPFVLVWAEKCLGLYRTVCSHTLIAVDIATGEAKPVATARVEGKVAVSADHRQVAIATTDGIFIKPLP
jgi:hypothetical protein